LLYWLYSLYYFYFASPAQAFELVDLSHAAPAIIIAHILFVTIAALALLTFPASAFGRISNTSIRQSSHVLMSAKTGDPIVIHWFRKGLRLHDNPGLLHALSEAKGGKIYPVYIVDGNCYQLLKCSVNRAKFLLECVQDLDNSLRERGSRLYVASGDPLTVLPKLWEEWGVTHLTHDADETGEPYATARDEGVREAAKSAGVKMQEFYSETLLPLGDVPGGYVKNCGGNAAGVPATMSSFQSLLNRINKGSIPLPSDAPKKEDFPEMIDEYKDKYLPLTHPCDIEWPRGLSKDEIGPVWNRADADKASNPIVNGGESLALEQLDRTVTKRPDW
jgi:cryptochrome